MSIAMTDYRIEVNTYNWSCECCGSGEHIAIDLFDGEFRIWGTSLNDQFGGVFRDGDDDSISLRCGYEPVVDTMIAVLKALGHNVNLGLKLGDEYSHD
jgi:hypothetical protein